MRRGERRGEGGGGGCRHRFTLASLPAPPLQGDVARASATIAKLRQELRDEKKKRDKLLQNLEAQREVEVAAESMIQSLQERVALERRLPLASGGGGGGSGGGGGALSGVLNSPGSLASQASFMRSIGASLNNAPGGR